MRCPHCEKPLPFSRPAPKTKRLYDRLNFNGELIDYEELIAAVSDPAPPDASAEFLIYRRANATKLISRYRMALSKLDPPYTIGHRVERGRLKVYVTPDSPEVRHEIRGRSLRKPRR